MSNSLAAIKQDIIEDVKTLLGDNLVDVELNPNDYNISLKIALERYRQRSSNAVEEAYAFLELQIDQTEYYLPEEIFDVRQILRRGLGGTTGGTYLDPFSLAYTNLYLLQAGAGGGYTAGLLTFELFYEYQNQAGKMFGRDIMYTYNVVSKKLTIAREIQSPENVLLWVTKLKPDEMILRDPFAKPWLRSYTLAVAKGILGEAYSKFSQIIGPQGGTTLKGDALKSESIAEMEKLDIEILNLVDAGAGSGVMGIIHG